MANSLVSLVNVNYSGTDSTLWIQIGRSYYVKFNYRAHGYCIGWLYILELRRDVLLTLQFCHFDLFKAFVYIQFSKVIDRGAIKYRVCPNFANPK